MRLTLWLLLIVVLTAIFLQGYLLAVLGLIVYGLVWYADHSGRPERPERHDDADGG